MVPLLNVSEPLPVRFPVTDTVALPLLGWQVERSQTALENVVVTVKPAIACSTAIEPDAMVLIDAEVSVVIVSAVGTGHRASGTSREGLSLCHSAT
jgi:hypothetical protein